MRSLPRLFNVVRRLTLFDCGRGCGGEKRRSATNLGECRQKALVCNSGNSSRLSIEHSRISNYFYIYISIAYLVLRYIISTLFIIYLICACRSASTLNMTPPAIRLDKACHTSLIGDGLSLRPPILSNKAAHQK
jgi:hypothetical protein